MNFYTLRSAIEKAIERGRGTMFWIPCLNAVPILDGAPHIWVMDPSGKKWDCHNNDHAIRIWIDKKGCLHQTNFPPHIPTLLKLEHRSDTMEIMYSDLAPHAQERYLRFNGALMPEEVNVKFSPIAVLERP